MTRRNHNWPEALNEIISKARTRPFVWGQNDCALFVADAIDAMTGIDVAAEFRGRYKTERGAAGQMKRFAGGGIPELADRMADEHGFDPVPVTFAQRGDAVEIETSDGPGLGICIGSVTVITSPAGVIDMPMAFADRAWRIE